MQTKQYQQLRKKKEIVGFVLGANYEEENKYALEFVSITCIASLNCEVLNGKIQKILLNNNGDISNTRFSLMSLTLCLMPGERTDLQRRIRSSSNLNLC